MSYGAFPDFLELDNRVIYELPLLSGENMPGLLPEPNRVHGLIANPSSPTLDKFRKSKTKPDIDIDLIELDSNKDQPKEKTPRDKSKRRDRAKSVRFDRTGDHKAPPPPPPRSDYPAPPKRAPPQAQVHGSSE